MRAVLGLALTFALAGCSSGETKDAKPKKHPVEESAVPKPVVTAMTAAHPTAKTTRWMEKGTVYTANAQDSGKWIEVAYNADGTLKEEQEELATPDAAPEPVKKAFAESPYAKMKFIDGIKKRNPTKEPHELYKFVVDSGSKSVIAVYDKDGKLLKEKEMPKEKLEKWRSEHTVAR
jgi:hypothetical protein